MPSISDGGIRIFSAPSKDALEDLLNTFLMGTGEIDNKKKILIETPTFLIDAGLFYAMIYYKISNS